MHGEKLASGVKHADNTAPCIFGGVTLVRSIFPLEVIALPSPFLHVTIVHPQIEVKTSDARSILKQNVQLKDAIKQWGNIAALVAGLMKEDYDLIGRSLEDVIIEPVRAILIPGFDDPIVLVLRRLQSMRSRPHQQHSFRDQLVNYTHRY